MKKNAREIASAEGYCKYSLFAIGSECNDWCQFFGIECTDYMPDHIPSLVVVIEKEDRSFVIIWDINTIIIVSSAEEDKPYPFPSSQNWKVKENLSLEYEYSVLLYVMFGILL